MKANDIEMLRYLCHHPADVEHYWNTIKIAKRAGYKFTDIGLWFDYIKMLERMGKDTNSSSLIAPKNLKTAHDIYIGGINQTRHSVIVNCNASYLFSGLLHCLEVSRGDFRSLLLTI